MQLPSELDGLIYKCHETMVASDRKPSLTGSSQKEIYWFIQLRKPEVGLTSGMS